MHDLAVQTGETVILVRLIGRSAVCVHRVQSAQQLRISFEPGQPLPLERGASARLLLASLAPDVRREYLAPLAERDPEAAALLEKKILMAGQQGYAISEEEIHKGVWAASVPVMQGKRIAGRAHRAVTAGPGDRSSTGRSCCARFRPRPGRSARNCVSRGVSPRGP